MGIVLNPLTGQLDFTGIASGGPSIATRHSTTFNNTTDWTLASPDYTISITAATHGKGINPTVHVFEQIGLIYEQVNTTVQINASGDVTIKVSETPDNRFAGVVIII